MSMIGPYRRRKGMGSLRFAFWCIVMETTGGMCAVVIFALMGAFYSRDYWLHAYLRTRNEALAGVWGSAYLSDGYMRGMDAFYPGWQNEVPGGFTRRNPRNMVPRPESRQ
jgi:hypothetical protein